MGSSHFYRAKFIPKLCIEIHFRALHRAYHRLLATDAGFVQDGKESNMINKLLGAAAIAVMPLPDRVPILIPAAPNNHEVSPAEGSIAPRSALPSRTDGNTDENQGACASWLAKYATVFA